MTMIEVLKETSPCPHLTNDQFTKVLEDPERFKKELNGQLRNELPDDISKLLDKCLSFNKNSRPSFSQIVDELELRTPFISEKLLSDEPTLKAEVQTQTNQQHPYENHDQINLQPVYENQNRINEKEKREVEMRNLTHPYDNLPG